MCGGYEVGCLSASQSVKYISKVWAKVQPQLLTNDSREALFNGSALTMKDGPISVSSLTGVPIY